MDDQTLEITIPKDLKQGIVNNVKDTHDYHFARVFDQDSTQEEVFELVGLPVLEK